MNYILDMQDRLPGLTDDKYRQIKLETTLSVKRLSPSEKHFCSELDSEMGSQGELSARGVSRTLDDTIVAIYRVL
jgi:hypothetical protein